METNPLVVRVEDIATRRAWVYVFESGPVWVGCGPDSSLVLARPSIAPQHGCFRFDHHLVRYQDLSPAVGTLVDGDPVGGREVPLTDWSQLEMGDLRVTVSRRWPEEPVADPALSPFARPANAAEAPLSMAPGFDAPPLPPTLVLPQTAMAAFRAPARNDAWSEIVDIGHTPIPRRSIPTSPDRRRKRGRSKNGGRRWLLWLFAMLLGGAIVGAAGLLLQYRGLPWMPAELATRIPPWLVRLFR